MESRFRVYGSFSLIKTKITVRITTAKLKVGKGCFPKLGVPFRESPEQGLQYFGVYLGVLYLGKLPNG